MIRLIEILKIHIRFIRKMPYVCHLRHPRTFNEKIQWLKLYDRRSEYVVMADKYAMKAYVDSKIGPGHVVPLLAVYDSVAEVDLQALPDRFVIKCNHDSKGTYICMDKSSADWDTVLRRLGKRLATDYSVRTSEWQYHDIPRKIIVEELLRSDCPEGIGDYKFFCFNGEPAFFKIDFDRDTDCFHSNYYDFEGNLLDFSMRNHPRQPGKMLALPPKDVIDEMISFSRILSAGYPFLRVDFYWVGGVVYVGELTVRSGSGLSPQASFDLDLRMGDYLQLPTDR